jgi:hypothetical protein
LPSPDTVVIAAPAKKLGSYFSEVATESAHIFYLKLKMLLTNLREELALEGLA